MNLSHRPVAALLIFGILSGAAHDPVAPPPIQEDDPVYVEEEKKDFLDKVDRYRAAGDWKGLFELQNRAAQPKNAHKLVRLPGLDPRYVGLIEYLNRKFADLPAEALDFYRGQFDGAAKLQFDRSRAAGDRPGLERVVDSWFYSSRTDEALDLLANIHVEEGRTTLAIHCWSRLLYHYPDSDIPRAVTAARLARAAALSGHESVLDDVRRHVQETGLSGDVIIGDGPMNLADFLKSLKAEFPAAPAGLAVREPSIMSPGGSGDARLTAVRPEIRRWSAELAESGVGGGQARGGAINDFPFLPAYTRIDGHEMVAYTNGFRVTIIDPSRANSSRPEEGVYFSYPPPGETGPRPQSAAEYRGISWTRPYIGVTIDGDQAFATLYSTKRTREAPGPGEMPDPLLGTTRLVCLNLRTQQVAWDTDFGEPAAQMRKLEFWDRNFAFSGPPLVRGDRVYAGIGTSPIREEESRVLCLDRRTGVPVWQRFLASANTGWGRRGYSGSLVSRLTVLEEDRGVLIAHSNVGALAALDAVTGHVRWLSKYPRTNLGGNEMGSPQIFSRPASPLVIHRGRIYALAQDCADLLVADLASGVIQKEAPKVEIMMVPRPWREFHRMVGRMGDYLVFGGAAASQDSCILNTASGSTYGLTQTPTAGTGRGIIDGETLYLPHMNGSSGGLGIYHGQRHWQAFERSTLWWPLGEGAKGEGGNIVRAGNYLILTSATRISLITDVEVVRAEYRRRLEQSPPNPAAWLDYGQLMRTNERWSEAARGYLSFIESVQGDAEWMGRAREVRTELHGIFLKLGLEAAGRKLPVDAAAHYGRARDFAWDGPTMTEATRLLAGACETVAETQADPAERRAWARRAVEEYQELIRRSPPGFVKPGDSMLWVPIRRLASARIAGLLKRHGLEAYSGVARAADEELKRAGQNPASLRALADLYPESTAAIEALQRLADQAAGERRWVAVASALRDMRFRLGDRWTPAHQKRLHDALEKSGDAERLEAELTRMARQFEASQKMGPDEGSPTVADYLAKARPAAAGLSHRAPEAPPGSTATLSTWDAAVATSGPFQVPVSWDLIVPGGLEPNRWSADVEFFARGSAVELWNIRTKKRVWSAAHPGGWTGVAYSEAGATARGVLVTDVIADSPAAKAGLQPGDVIRSIDGVPVSEDDFDLATEARAPGVKLAVDYKRGEESRRAEIAPVAWPASSRPGIVGAVFTAEGSIVVGWEDLVAAFDLADGRSRWVSRPGRSRFVIRALHAASDRILAHEHYLQDRCRSSYRSLTRAGMPALPAEDQHSRVHALDESDGASVWALGLRFDWATAQHHSVQFVGRPLDSLAGVMVSGFQSNVRVLEFVPVAVEDGKAGQPINLTAAGGQLATVWTVEPSTGTLWVIDASNPGRPKLRSYVRPDYARGVEIPLEAHLDAAATGYSLASNDSRVAVLSLSRQAASPRLAVFSTRDGSLVAAHRPTDGPLKDRQVPGLTPSSERRMLPGLLQMEPDGRLLLYNESRSSVESGSIRRATLTALSIADGAFKIDWDAVTPTITPPALGEREVLSVRPGPKGYFVTTSRGLPPGKSEESTIVAFHSRKEEGAVRKLYDDLVLTTDAFGVRKDPAPVRRGRIFLNRKGGVEILGD